MKNKVLAFLLSILLLLPTAVLPVFAAPSDDVVILYENDAHCAVEGYSKLSAMKRELQESYAHVGVVSGGDYVQGSSLGVISQGEYVVDLMNLVGYDAVALGNHEFDYRMERLNELVGKMDTKPVCCNFQKVGESTPYFQPYSIVSYGSVDVAYIGITTPSTISSSSPTQFKDENGNFLYTFHATDLYETVQNSIDAAKADGADVIIALSHIGYAEDDVYGDLEDVETLVKNTAGFDVVLDAHSHSVIAEKKITDKSGEEVLVSSTGTKFEYIGKLTISDGTFQTELVKTADYQKTDAAVDTYIQKIYNEYATLGERKVATSEVDLIIKDSEGKRLVRKAETNLGDLVAESFRYAGNADIGYVNGGGLRAAIPKGDVTFNHLLSVLSFNNTLVVAEISGQTLLDMMEMAMRIWPEENGAFPHIAGVTFSVNTAIPSSVVLNEYEEFVGVNGDYRVYDLKIFNKESAVYEPVKLDETYTIAASNYYLLDCGSGLTMLKNVKIIRNDGMLDVEALERYVVEKLGGVIGREYASVQTNLTFTDGYALENTVPSPSIPEPAIPEPDREEETVSRPQTGDPTTLSLWVFLAIFSACSLAALKKVSSNKNYF